MVIKQSVFSKRNFVEWVDVILFIFGFSLAVFPRIILEFVCTVRDFTESQGLFNEHSYTSLAVLLL